MVALRMLSSVSDSCRMHYHRKRVCMVSVCNGNVVGGYNHGVCQLLIHPPHLDFRGRCVEKLEKLGDTARDSKNHEKAIVYYTTMLLLDPTNVNDILLKRNNEVWIVLPITSNGLQ